jgi:hypothetical protein
MRLTHQSSMYPRLLALAIFVLATSTSNAVTARPGALWSAPLLGGSTTAQESLSDELIRRQNQNGLTLVSISSSKVHAIDFTSHSLNLAPDALKNLGFEYGTVSPDGTQAALEICGSTPRIPQLRDAEGNCSHGSLFGTAMLDGSGLRTIPGIKSPSYFACWSPDASKFALSGGPASDLEIVDSHTGESQSIEGDESDSFFEPQCWSRDGSLVVFTRNEPRGKRTVVTYNIQTKQKIEIASGGNATWIPRTDWISYMYCGVDLHYCTYYEVRPDGSDAKVLFKTTGAGAALSWSRDGRLAAYISVGRWTEPIGVGSRVRVWRITDNSEVWVANRRETDPALFQWIENKKLLSGTDHLVK